MSWRSAQAADLRLVILRILAEAPGFECGAPLLRAALEDYGHRIGRDRLMGELAWLAEQGLIVEKHLGDVVALAQLTPRGEDVARGRTVVPNVARPAPGE
jgi:hypothetical protein